MVRYERTVCLSCLYIDKQLLGVIWMLFGHVNNVQYYRYIESARIAYLMALNIFDQDIVTVVASSQCKYLKPVFYPDVLHIGARIEELRNSAFQMHYSLWSETQNQIVATGGSDGLC